MVAAAAAAERERERERDGTIVHVAVTTTTLRQYDVVDRRSYDRKIVTTVPLRRRRRGSSVVKGSTTSSLRQNFLGQGAKMAKKKMVPNAILRRLGRPKRPKTACFDFLLTLHPFLHSLLRVFVKSSDFPFSILARFRRLTVFSRTVPSAVFRRSFCRFGRMPPKTPANARGTASLSEPPASPATSDVTILSGPDLFALAANRTAEERRALENVIVERDAEVQALKTSLSDSEATVQLLRSGQSEKIVEAEEESCPG